MGRQSVSILQLQIHLNSNNNKQVKFLHFSETRRVVLNQILRQSSAHLANGRTFSVLVDHIRVLDFNEQLRFFALSCNDLMTIVRQCRACSLSASCECLECPFRKLYRRNLEE